MNTHHIDAMDKGPFEFVGERLREGPRQRAMGLVMVLEQSACREEHRKREAEVI
jgi:hypothetical protein